MGTYSIPIAKGGKGASIDVDTEALPDAMIQMAVAEGLKVLLNGRMSKVGATSKLEGDELAKAQASAMKIANENFDKLKSGTLAKGARSTKSDTGEVKGRLLTEARKLAREVVKNMLKEKKVPISHLKASQITAAADAMIAAQDQSDPTSFVARAKALIEANASIKPAASIDLSQYLVEDPTLVAKDAEKKAAAKASAPLSAKQAGMPAPRKSGGAGRESYVTH